MSERGGKREGAGRPKGVPNKTTTEIRDAFRSGMNKGSHQSYFDAPLDETEYIDSIKDKLKLFFIPVVSVPFCKCNCQGSESDCSNER